MCKQKFKQHIDVELTLVTLLLLPAQNLRIGKATIGECQLFKKCFVA
jgi:hypothetical protein